MGVSARTKMTWESGPRRWRKVYRGKTYTVSCKELGCPETKEGSYRAANEWWEAKLAEIQGQTELHPHQEILDEIDKRIAWAARHGMGPTISDLERKRNFVASLGEYDADIAQDVVASSSELNQRIEAVEQLYGDLFPAEMTASHKAFLLGENTKWEERLQQDGDLLPPEKTVAGLVKSWLANKELEMRAGQLAPKRLDNLKYDMRSIEEAIGSNVAVETINEQTVDRVYQFFMLAIVNSKVARETAKTRWGLFRTLVRFGWSRRLYDLPRNLDEKSITSPPKTVPTWTLDEIKSTMAVCPGQLRLHLLLMLNCGMYQKDVSDLQDNEVDWKHGTITRRRSKTSKQKDTPIVTYRLWPETFALLKQYRSGEKTVLLTGDGRPWVRAEPKADGKIAQCDGIARNYRRLISAHKKKNPRNPLPARPLKELRKTSATLLDKHPQYGRYTSYFLGHSPRSIADKNYVDPSREQFDLACPSGKAA